MDSRQYTNSWQSEDRDQGESAIPVYSTATAICIAGMHRSGTTLVARLLQACGCYLGPDSEFLPPARDNPDGFWENRRVVALNDRILSLLDGAWDLPPALHSNWELLPGLIPLRVQAALLLKELSQASFWGWKDPRTSLTLPFWLQLVPNLQVVICIRNPLEVASSLRRRNGHSLAFGFQLWQAYYERLLAAVPPEARLFTSFDAYHTEPRRELSRVLGKLGISRDQASLDAACALISPEMRHQRFDERQLIEANISPEVLRLYLDLRRADSDSSAALPQPEQDVLASWIAPEALWEDYRDALKQLRMEAQLADQAYLADARWQELNALRPVLAARDEELASVKPVLETRDEELNALRPVLAARDEELNALRPVLAARDEELNALRPVLAARDEELASVKPVLAARDEELNALRPVLAARDQELVSTKASLATHQRELQELRASLQTRDSELAFVRPVLRARQLAKAVAQRLLAIAQRLRNVRP